MKEFEKECLEEVKEDLDSILAPDGKPSLEGKYEHLKIWYIDIKHRYNDLKDENEAMGKLIKLLLDRKIR